ncbi:MAG: undecaprenyl-diphosphate phosphatase [Oscillospiraceae bacterium]|nr:undecaprenyl-diphosphate phosphatase [Oscillospiraceae bacterium]
MSWLESILYGLVVGFADFLPISSFAHSHILSKLFGEATPNPVVDLFVHIAILVAVLQANRSILEQAKRQRTNMRHRHETTESTAILEMRFLKNAILPMFLAFFLLRYVVSSGLGLAWVALFSLINGILLFSQGRMMKGNKGARSLSGLDSVLAGFAGGIFVFPGISRISAILTVLTARGVDKDKAADWTILLSLPALVLIILNDLLNILAASGSFGFPFLNCILAGIFAYVSGNFAIRVFKRIAAARDFSGFAYYSWGIALFAFILYLTIV